MNLVDAAACYYSNLSFYEAALNDCVEVVEEECLMVAVQVVKVAVVAMDCRLQHLPDYSTTSSYFAAETYSYLDGFSDLCVDRPT